LIYRAAKGGYADFIVSMVNLGMIYQFSHAIAPKSDTRHLKIAGQGIQKKGELRITYCDRLQVTRVSLSPESSLVRVRPHRGASYRTALNSHITLRCCFAFARPEHCQRRSMVIGDELAI
jgi:hypothetical protein